VLSQNFYKLQIFQRVIHQVTFGHLSTAANSKTLPRNTIMCIVLLLEYIASQGCMDKCKFRSVNSQLYSFKLNL